MFKAFLSRSLRSPAPSGPRPAACKEPPTHVLFVSRQRIVGRTNGSSAYLLDLAEAARAAGFVPHLLQPSPDLLGRWPVMRLRPELEVFESHAIRGVLRIGSWVITRNPAVAIDGTRALLSRLVRRWGSRHPLFADRPRPYAIAAHWTRADRAFLRERAKGRADIVLADYAFQAEALRILPGVPSAIVMHDLFHRRTMTDGTGAHDSVASLDREREIDLLATADVVVAIQASEAQFVTDHVQGTRALLAPMAARPVRAPQPGQRGLLLFVGSNTAPNVVALEWFFEAVWPLIRAQAPQMRLEIAGSVATAFSRGAPPGVTFMGLVDDLAPFYARAGVVISPLTFGSGLKIKLVEALAQGKAMVVTSVTLQGVEAECTPSVAVADDPFDFARAVLDLQDQKLRNTLARQALDAAQIHFSPSASHAAFIAWLEEARCGCIAAPSEAAA